jgi:hypothetical protein
MITPPPATTVVPKTTSATGVGVGIANSASQSGAVAISGQGGRGGNSSLTINNPANTTSTATVNQNLSGTTTQNINSKVSGSTRTEVVSSGTTTVKNVPSTVAPGLAAAGLETCLGSASGTVSLAGLGIGGGSTYRDEDCTARLDSRTLFAMGLKGAAVARLCVRPDIWRSMPDICAQYWPVGQPLPQGIYVAAPLVAPAGTYMSTSLRVIDGRDGVEKDCLNYNATKFRCNQWAGEAPKRQRSAALTPAKKPLPSHQTKPKIDPPQLPTEITAGSPAPSNQ